MTTKPRNPSQPFPESEAYARLGVSSAKADVERAATALAEGIVPSAFCRIAPDVFQGDPAYCTVSHSDGAGSKSILAYLKLCEDGDVSGFRQIAHDALVMNLDDVICCGVTSGFAYVSVINRHAGRIGPEVVSAIIEGTLDSIGELSKHGIEIVFCGGETADVGDIVRTVLVDGALTARFERSHIVRNQLTVGHVVVGLSGHGPPATYERAWNSGMGSNGVTLARRALLSSEVARAFPEVAGESTAPDVAYFGPWRTHDLLPGTNVPIIDALLSPTRTFAPIIREFLALHRDDVSGIFHNTGGGQVKSLKGAKGFHIKKRVPTPLPPLFTAIGRSAQLGAIELAKVFNLGWRMEVCCDERAAASLIQVAKGFGVAAEVIGHVDAGTPGRRKLTLTVDDQTATFED
jgi:phosphoribosylformylglycinamidine cyclo-ligase